MNDLQIAKRVASRIIEADQRFQPPKQIVNGVDNGELPAKVLMIWKYTVERLGAKFNYGAGTAYWRNKCRKEGIDLPSKYLKGGEGAEFGPWKIKTGDQIEDWVRERLKSEGLISDVARTAAEWQLEISHLESAIEDAKDRIVKHREGLAAGNRVNQREKWLAEAEKDLSKATKDLDKARQAVEDLSDTVQKHSEHKAPVVEFEKQFQFAMMLALQNLDKKDVIEAAKSAIAKFEAQVTDAQAAELAETQQAVEEAIPPTLAVPYKAANMEKLAIVMMLFEGLKKLYDIVKGAFESLVDWTKDILGINKSVKKMLAQAGVKG